MAAAAHAYSTCLVQTPASAVWHPTRISNAPGPFSPWKGKALKGMPALKWQPRRALPAVFAKHYLVEKVTGDELCKILNSARERLFVVDFYATWCGPCIQIAQDLEMLAVEHADNVKFIKIDTDEEWELARNLQIRGLPTVLFVSKDAGKTISRVEGAATMELMRDIIQNEL